MISALVAVPGKRHRRLIHKSPHFEGEFPSGARPQSDSKLPRVQWYSLAVPFNRIKLVLGITTGLDHEFSTLGLVDVDQRDCHRIACHPLDQGPDVLVCLRCRPSVVRRIRQRSGRSLAPWWLDTVAELGSPPRFEETRTVAWDSIPHSARKR
jgi:hypothetical protein